MTKRESISKERLDLSRLVVHWKLRASAVKEVLRLNPGDPRVAEQLSFCEAEKAKALEKLKKLRNGTIRQRRAGWGRGF